MKTLCCSLALLCAAQLAHGQGQLSFAWKKLAMGGATAIAVSPDDKEVAITADNDAICFFDSVTGKFLRHISGASYVHKLDYSPDGKTFAFCRSYDTLWIADAHTGEVRWRSHYSQSVTSASFSADSQLVGGGGQGQANLWRASDGTLLWQLKDPLIGMATLSPDGKRMAVFRKNVAPSIQIWDIASNTIVDQLGALSPSDAYPCFSNDGQLLAAGLPNVGTFVWRLSDHAILHFLPYASSNSEKCKFSPNDKLLVESFGVKDIILDTGNWSVLDQIDGGSAHLQFSSDSASLFLPSRTAYRYDLANKKSTPYKGEAPADARVVFSASGKTMAVNTELWNAETGERVGFLNSFFGPILASPTSNIFVSGGSIHGQFILLDANTGHWIKTLLIDTDHGQVFTLRNGTFTPDGKLFVALVAGNDWDRIEVWDAENWVKLRDFWADRYSERLAVDPNKKWIAFQSGDTLTAFDIVTGNILFENHEQYYPNMRQLSALEGGKVLGVSIDTTGLMRRFRCSNWTELPAIPYPRPFDNRFNTLFNGSVGVVGTELFDLRFTDMRNGNVLAQYPMPSSRQFVATSNDSSRFAISSGPLFGVFKNPLPYQSKTSP